MGVLEWNKLCLRTLWKELCEHIGDKTFKTVKEEEPIQVLITGKDSQKGANKEIAQAISKIHELKQAANPEKDVVVTLFSKDQGPKKIYNVGKYHRILSKMIYNLRFISYGWFQWYHDI